MDKNIVVAVVAIQNWLPNVYVLFDKKVCLRKILSIRVYVDIWEITTTPSLCINVVLSWHHGCTQPKNKKNYIKDYI
jgi:hypothetical protein